MNKKVGNVKQILVATDFSENSQCAFDRAIQIAQSLNAKLTILHVAKKQLLNKIIVGIIPPIKKVLITPEEYATALLKNMIHNGLKNKIKVNYMVLKSESPGPAILKFAKENKFDLLVLGAHGKATIKNWFVGTTAEYVSRKSSTPVLIVKNPAKKTYQKMLIPTDFSSLSQDALLFANKIFSVGEMRLLYVGDNEREDFINETGSVTKNQIKQLRETALVVAQTKMKKLIESVKGSLKKILFDIQFGYPGSVIVNEAKRIKCDVIVMGTEGHSARHYLFIGRVASLVLLQTDRDILLVPPTAKK